MKVSFQDFYGQYININDETASGNIRMSVRTMPDINNLDTEEKCTLETDISLDAARAKILLNALKVMTGEE